MQLFALTCRKAQHDEPVYTIWSACVNFAFDSVYYSLDLSELHFHYFFEGSVQNFCTIVLVKLSASEV